MTQADDALTAWFALLLAGLLEVAWALGLKYSDGLTRLWPSVGMVTAIGLSSRSRSEPPMPCGRESAPPAP
jgi:hypothetical protein